MEAIPSMPILQIIAFRGNGNSFILYLSKYILYILDSFYLAPSSMLEVCSFYSVFCLFLVRRYLHHLSFSVLAGVADWVWGYHLSIMGGIAASPASSKVLMVLLLLISKFKTTLYLTAVMIKHGKIISISCVDGKRPTLDIKVHIKPHRQ